MSCPITGLWLICNLCCITTVLLLNWYPVHWMLLELILTWPKMKSIKAIGAQTVSHPIASPTFSTSGPRVIAFGASPANTQVSGLRCEEGINMIHNQLIVPPSMLSWLFSHGQEDVWPHAVVMKFIHLKHFMISCNYYESIAQKVGSRISYMYVAYEEMYSTYK